MRKIISGLVILFVSFSTQAAESLQLWHAHQAKGFIDNVVDGYIQAHNQPVDLSLFSPDKIKGELLLNAQSGIMPDAIIVPSDFLGLHNELGLKPLSADWNNPALIESARQTAVIDEQQYGVPVIQGNHLMLFFNRKYVSSPARTWQQLFKEKSRLAEMDVKTIGWNYGEMYWFVAFLGAFDGQPITGNQITLNTPAMRRALEFYRSLSDRGMIDAECNYECAQGDFINGKFAYAINGDWALKDLQRELGENFGVATLPSIDDRPMQPMTSSYVIAFPSKQYSADKLAALMALARYFQTDEVQQHTYERFQLLPTNQVTFDRLLKQASEEDEVLLEQLKTTQPMPSVPAMSLTWQALAKGYNRFMQHDYTADEAAAYMQSLAERELQKRK